MIGASLPSLVRILGRLAMPLMYVNEPALRALTRGFKLNARQYMEALARRDALVEQMERFLAGWDAWLCPVTPTPAFTHRRSGLSRPARPIEVDGHRLPYWMGNISYAIVFNLMGNPVVVLPLDRSSEGLPIGVQVVGRRWRDMELLAVAGQLAEVTKPFQFPPGY